MDNPEIFKFFPEPVFKFQFENFRNFNPELSEYIYKLSISEISARFAR